MINEALTRLLSARGLPEPPPDDPFPTLMSWWDDAFASKKYEDPNAIALATATPEGAPSVRMVLCKSIEPARGAITFYTNYESRKGLELTANPRAAAVFHWPHATRQVRIAGPVEKLSAEESDAYFHARPLLSRIGAVASPQSRVLQSRAELLKRAVKAAAEAELTGELARPAWWGGYRLIGQEVELWCGHEGRLHQRVAWKRAADGRWAHQLLAP